MRSFCLLLAGLLLAAGVAVGFASPGAADTGPYGVSIQISSLTPLSPGPKDTLRITGTVVNRGSANLTRLQIGLHIGRSISSRSELHALRAQPVRSLLASQQVVGDNFPPGSTLPFTLSMPISELSLIVAGVYPMQIVAVGDVDGMATDLDAINTFLPYIPTNAATAASKATPLAWLVPLTAPPSLLADGSFISDGRSPTSAALLRDVAPDGRLRRLLDAVTTPGVQATAAIDPAVVRSLAFAANGNYQVTAPGSTPTGRQPANGAAKNWLSSLRDASGLELIGLPYADADIPSLLHNGHQPLADTARTRGSEVLRLGLGDNAESTIVPGIAVPPGGHVDRPVAAYYGTAVGNGDPAVQGGAASKANALVLAADSVPATGDNPSAVATVPGVSERLILSDDVLNQLVTQGPGTSARLAEQEIVAELAEAHLEDAFTSSPSRTGAAHSPQPLVIAPPRGWSPSVSWLRTLLSDTAKLAWLNQVRVSGITSTPAEPRAGLQYPASARASELPSYVVDGSAQIVTATQSLFRVPRKGDPVNPQSPQSIVQPIQDAAVEAVSSTFRSDPSGAQTFLDSAQTAFAALQSQVRVVASPQVTLTSKSGRVPVTIENNLPAAVDVSLELQSLDASRGGSGTTVTRTVRAGQKVQVEVEVHATSAGTFPVRLALYTPNGQPLGAPAQVLIRSTAYGIVATVFTVVALSLLGLAVLWRAVRALVRRSRQHTGSTPTPRGAGEA